MNQELVYYNLSCKSIGSLIIISSVGSNWLFSEEKLSLILDLLRGRTHLDAGLGEADAHGDLLAHEDVRIVGLREAALQLVQLGGREAGAVALLLVFVQVLEERHSQGGGRWEIGPGERVLEHRRTTRLGMQATHYALRITDYGLQFTSLRFTVYSLGEDIVRLG